ncbi:hypothetical protein J8273_7019 [Carpediemonas membranifera]|uniref:Uncharacterized protein n=1 Tax=Carpediemonas membranifera TaxID=201153 RepID=A0A8J6APZ8_9EUKA|nr:hypothetical protein J8273_7019 [Carpediemonas membranifera]|eukprot:KAG9390766.1 hypothetical protein J8273_7019 [Carpediemonas membranifera]
MVLLTIHAKGKPVEPEAKPFILSFAFCDVFASSEPIDGSTAFDVSFTAELEINEDVVNDIAQTHASLKVSQADSLESLQKRAPTPSGTAKKGKADKKGKNSRPTTVAKPDAEGTVSLDLDISPLLVSFAVKQTFITSGVEMAVRVSTSGPTVPKETLESVNPFLFEVCNITNLPVPTPEGDVPIDGSDATNRWFAPARVALTIFGKHFMSPALSRKVVKTPSGPAVPARLSCTMMVSPDRLHRVWTELADVPATISVFDRIPKEADLGDNPDLEELMKYPHGCAQIDLVELIRGSRTLSVTAPVVQARPTADSRAKPAIDSFFARADTEIGHGCRNFRSDPAQLYAKAAYSPCGTTVKVRVGLGMTLPRTEPPEIVAEEEEVAEGVEEIRIEEPRRGFEVTVLVLEPSVDAVTDISEKVVTANIVYSNRIAREQERKEAREKRLAAHEEHIAALQADNKKPKGKPKGKGAKKAEPVADEPDALQTAKDDFEAKEAMIAEREGTEEAEAREEEARDPLRDMHASDAFASLSLRTLAEDVKHDPTVSVVTGLHLCDHKFDLFLLEAPVNSGILDSILPAVTGKNKLLRNPTAVFPTRHWPDMPLSLVHFRLSAPLLKLAAQPKTWTTCHKVPKDALTALDKFVQIVTTATYLSDVLSRQLLPTPTGVEALQKAFAGMLGKNERGHALIDFEVSEATDSRSLVPNDLARLANHGIKKQSAEHAPRIDNSNPKFVDLQKTRRMDSAGRDFIAKNKDAVLNMSLSVQASRPPKEPLMDKLPEHPQGTFNYSSQALNYSQYHRQKLERIAQAKHVTLGYSKEYTSGAIDTVGQVTVARGDSRDEKSAWRTKEGFNTTIVPKHETGVSQSRADELQTPWDEEAALSLQMPITREEMTDGRAKFTLALDQPGMFENSPEFLKSVHLPGPQGAKEIEALRLKEKEEWRRKIVVDPDQVRLRTMPDRSERPPLTIFTGAYEDPSRSSYEAVLASTRPLHVKGAEGKQFSPMTKRVPSARDAAKGRGRIAPLGAGDKTGAVWG